MHQIFEITKSNQKDKQSNRQSGNSRRRNQPDIIVYYREQLQDARYTTRIDTRQQRKRKNKATKNNQ